MKVCNKILLVAILLFIFSSNVKAEACDTDDIKRLRVLAENVEITSEYNDDIYDSDGFKIYDTYKIIINNLTEELYVIEDKTDVSFENYTIKDGMITVDRMYSGSKRFKVYSKTCDKLLKTYYVDLLPYNRYSTDSNCEGKEDLEICQKFYDSSDIDYDEFLEMLEDKDVDDEQVIDDNEKEEFDIIKFIRDNYFYIVSVCVVLIILIIVVMILRRKKRGVLE